MTARPAAPVVSFPSGGGTARHRVAAAANPLPRRPDQAPDGGSANLQSGQPAGGAPESWRPIGAILAATDIVDIPFPGAGCLSAGASSGGLRPALPPPDAAGGDRSPLALPAASFSDPCRRGSPVHFLPVELRRVAGGRARAAARRFFMGGVVIAALAALALAAWSLPARAHSWYDDGCCHDRDCAPAPKGAVTRVPGGWHVRLAPWQTPSKVAVDVVVPDGAATIRKSQDENFHVCVGIATVTGRGPVGFVRCLYLPEFGT